MFALVVKVMKKRVAVNWLFALMVENAVTAVMRAALLHAAVPLVMVAATAIEKQHVPKTIATMAGLVMMFLENFLAPVQQVSQAIAVRQAVMTVAPILARMVGLVMILQNLEILNFLVRVQQVSQAISVRQAVMTVAPILARMVGLVMILQNLEILNFLAPVQQVSQAIAVRQAVMTVAPILARMVGLVMILQNIEILNFLAPVQQVSQAISVR